MFEGIKKYFGTYGKCPVCGDNLTYNFNCYNNEFGGWAGSHFYNHYINSMEELVSMTDVRFRITKINISRCEKIQCVFSNKHSFSIDYIRHRAMIQIVIPNSEHLIWLPEEEFKEKIQKYLNLV